MPSVNGTFCLGGNGENGTLYLPAVRVLVVRAGIRESEMQARRPGGRWPRKRAGWAASWCRSRGRTSARRRRCRAASRQDRPRAGQAVRQIAPTAAGPPYRRRHAFAAASDNGSSRPTRPAESAPGSARAAPSSVRLPRVGPDTAPGPPPYQSPVGSQPRARARRAPGVAPRRDGASQGRRGPRRSRGARAGETESPRSLVRWMSNGSASARCKSA